MATEALKSTDRIFEIITNKDDVSWKSVIYDLVKSEQMDPWDVDITGLTRKYIEVVKQLQEFDFRVSGKVVLAAAILLRIKSKHLVGKDIEELDRLLASRNEEDVDEFYEELGYEHMQEILRQDDDIKQPELIPKTPQPRIRKVSVYDLINALEQALEVKKRRVLNSIPNNTVEIPKKSVNISRSIKDIYRRILELFRSEKRMTFTNLLPDKSKESKVFTFIPLLHLSNTGKIELEQPEPFGDIGITLKSEKISGLK